ncbi:MAG: hypothetical protein MUO34_01895 [Ignavibacteriaceae bacterium]|nr:hypothetical protein [Ignavibacteriaceae bacterium]
MNGLLSRKYDAWLSGWSVEIPLKLDNFWSSDPEKGMLNFSSFTNPELENIFADIKPADDEAKKTILYKKASNIFKENEPVTILFWSDNIIAYNKRIKIVVFLRLDCSLKLGSGKQNNIKCRERSQTVPLIFSKNKIKSAAKSSQKRNSLSNIEEQ